MRVKRERERKERERLITLNSIMAFCSKAIYTGGKEWRWTRRTKRVKRLEKGRAKKDRVK